MITISVRNGLTVLVALLVGLSVHAQQMVYDGAALLFNLDSVMVVYPERVGPGAELARRSAEDRARFLREVRGCRTEVIADTAVGAGELEGHLLLLGWDNRLLRRAELVGPVRGTEVQRNFLGQVPVPPDGDLLFAQNSPFNPNKLLVFWSRIDPEMDRLLQLPFLGSDWAVYSGYAPIHQGNFLGDSWPLQRNTVAEMNHGALIEQAPLQHRSAHYDLHAPNRTITNEDAKAIFEAREKALSQAASRAGAALEGFRIRLFVYADDEDKAQRSGIPDPVHSVVSRHELHMTRRHALAANPHEELHHLTRASLGPCFSTALYEGYALDLGEAADANELSVFGALMVKKRSIPAIADLLDEERFRQLARSGVGFSAAGLLVRWVRQASSPGAFEAWFARPRPDLDTLADATGIATPKLQKRFDRWVADQAKGAEDELAFRTARAEASSYREQGDDPAVIAALERALKARPSDPLTLYELGLARIRTEEFAEAERALHRLVALSVGPGQIHLVAFGHYQLGRLFTLQDRLQDAASSYRKVLELPDRYNSHSMALDAMEAPISLEAP